MFPRRSDECGYSVLELLVTFAVMSVVTGFMIFNLKELEDPVRDGADSFLGFLKRSRAKALATTYAYTIYPIDNQHVEAMYGTTCADTDTEVDEGLTFALEGNAEFTATDWEICYSSRGLSEDSEEVTIANEEVSRTVEIALGGAARIQP